MNKMWTLKRYGLILGVFVMALSFAACGNTTTEQDLEEVENLEFSTPVAPSGDAPGVIADDGALELTLEELSYYDGRDGRRAYVAVDGMIYDMTDSSYWRNGGHNGNQAGQDLSNAIGSSPHGRGNLLRVPKIGRIVE
jgi:predicted heme/steroid binding protein